MLKDLLKIVAHPLFLAGVAGASSYYFLGRQKKGKTPYLIAGGGAVVGYLVGKQVTTYLAGPVAPQVQQVPVSPQIAPSMEQVEIPEPTPAGRAEAPVPRGSTAGYGDFADGSLGSLSPSPGFNADSLDIDDILKNAN